MSHKKKILTSLLPNATLDDIHDAALQLIKSGNYNRGAVLLERSPEYKGATPDYILRAANVLKSLANIHYGGRTKYHDKAAELYEQLAKSGNPEIVGWAADGFAALSLNSFSEKSDEYYNRSVKLRKK